jgi:hypothetical protein
LCDLSPFVGEELPFVGASAPLAVDRLRRLLRNPTVAPAGRVLTVVPDAVRGGDRGIS